MFWQRSAVLGCWMKHTVLYMYKTIKEKRIKHPLIKLILPALPLPCHTSHGKTLTKSSGLPQGSSEHLFSSLKLQKLLLSLLLSHPPKGQHHSRRASQPDMLLQCNTYEFSLSLLLSSVVCNPSQIEFLLCWVSSPAALNDCSAFEYGGDRKDSLQLLAVSWIV